MIAANVSVGQFIHEKNPTCALLRRHPIPSSENFQQLISLASSLGFEIDASSNKALASSLAKATVSNNAVVNRVLRIMATFAMSEAE